MAKQDKMKTYKKRQHILICCLSILFVILLFAAVILFVTKDSEPIKGGHESGIQADVGNNGTQGGFYFAESEITLKPGETRYADVINKTGLQDGYIWNSSNVSVAFAEEGVITGVAEGSCDITVKISGTEHIALLRVFVEEAEETEPQEGTEPEETTSSESSEKTENGKEIVVEDGCTYIDGILIANKTYSLPADYDPGASDEALAAFDEMSADAESEGLNIYISSGYRSYYDQERIYNNYAASDGAEVADTYSSRPGHSDHQTGLAFDLNSIDDSFGYTPESDWVAANAHKYGFIIRFPEGKDEYTGYQYEPWHIRYLGVEKATEVFESGLSLEEFLGISSEYQD